MKEAIMGMRLRKEIYRPCLSNAQRLAAFIGCHAMMHIGAEIENNIFERSGFDDYSAYFELITRRRLFTPATPQSR